MNYANRFDRAVAGIYEAREADWRNGAVVYQVLVDRFAPSADLAAKQHLYPAPKRLRSWDEVPAKGKYLKDHKLWSHEIDFWGGDLASTAARLDYVVELGADVLYLNPICLAYTNHKYDALDYLDISPEYGTREDVKRLAEDLHARGLKLVLLIFLKILTTDGLLMRCMDTCWVSGAADGSKAVGRGGSQAGAGWTNVVGWQDARAGSACGGRGAADRVHLEGGAR